jgi:DNA-binding transcriptional ArsR family regulator
MTNVGPALAALADPTRRIVFERVARRPRSVSELARGLAVSRPAVSQHLAVLKAARLVTARADGTRHIYHLDRGGVGVMRAWLDQFWEHALSAFKIAADSHDEDSA